MLIPSKYWNIDRTLTHNVLFYVIVGNRTAGKTYGCKKKGINNFIKKGEQFAYVRRYEKDLKESLPTFFDDIIKNNEYPEYEFKVEFFETQEYFRERLDSVFVNAYQPCFYESTFWTNDFMVTFYVCRTSSYQPNKQCDNGNFCYDGYSYVGFCETFQIYGVNEIRVQDGKNLNNKSKDEIIQAVTNGMMSKNGVNCITVKS